MAVTDTYELLFDTVGRLPSGFPEPWPQELNSFAIQTLKKFQRKSPLNTT